MDILTKHGTHNNPALKIVTAILFILFPIIGFAFGMQYQAALDYIQMQNSGLVPFPTPTPTPPKTKLEIMDDTWGKYTNSNLGYSVRIPRQAISFYGDCKYSTENGDHSYRPTPKAVPIQVLENNGNVYVVGEYNYLLSAQTKEDSRSFYSSCTKTDITLNKVLNPQKDEHVSPNLKFFSRTVTNDQELTRFIKDNYGKDCDLGKKIQAKQPGTYSVEIGGATSPDSGKDCFVNYMYSIRYNPAKNLVIAWNMGQACNFAYPTQTDCLDEKVSNSFQFE